MVCGLCAEGHDTHQCRTAQKDYPIDQITPLNCAGCWSPHAASDKNCPIRRAAVYQHWCNNGWGLLFPSIAQLIHCWASGLARPSLTDPTTPQHVKSPSNTFIPPSTLTLDGKSSPRPQDLLGPWLREVLTLTVFGLSLHLAISPTLSC